MTGRLDLTVARTAKVIATGDVDDIITLTWTNPGSAALILPGALTFTYRDCPTTLVSARDREGTWEPRWHDRLDEDEKLVIEPDGAIEPGTRVMAVRTTRKRLAAVRDDAVSFRDPFYRMPLNAVISPPRYNATVLFPSLRQRTVIAPSAADTTSCTAVFEFGAAANHKLEYLPIEADWKLTPLAASPTAIDDAIAHLRWAIALNALGELYDLDKVCSLCADLSLTLPHSEALATLSYWDRMRMLDTALKALETRRRQWLEAPPVPARWAITAASHAEAIGREVIGLLGTGAAIPSNATDALIDLLEYQRLQRDAPTKWRKPIKEAQFQERVSEFLVGHGSMALREVPIAGGRADFLLGQTPIELKVDDLDPTEPFAKARRYLPQAAEYASARGLRLAILLVLDRHTFEGPHGYLPRPNEQVHVELVPSIPGIGGRSHVAVITIVVTAFPPQPSQMRPARSSLRK